MEALKGLSRRTNFVVGVIVLAVLVVAAALTFNFFIRVG